MPKAPPRTATHRHAGHFFISAGLMASLLLPHAAPAAGLNDSGQNLCYNGTTPTWPPAPQPTPAMPPPIPARMAAMAGMPPPPPAR